MIYNNSNDSLLSDNIYSRDVSGRELAIYKNGSIDQWNIYGMDNIGFIDGNEDIRFYMKDHLGSIRAVTDVSGNVVSSQDGACPRMLQRVRKHYHNACLKDSKAQRRAF